MVQQELAVEKRIVLDSTHFTAFCPYASRFPFETWIVPKNHSSHFENIPKPGVDDLGARARTRFSTSSRLALDNPAYNYIIHTAPFDHERAAPLPLAHRGDSAAEQGRGFRVGLGLLHQPGSSRRCGGFLA